MVFHILFRTKIDGSDVVYLQRQHNNLPRVFAVVKSAITMGGGVRCSVIKRPQVPSGRAQMKGEDDSR